MWDNVWNWLIVHHIAHAAVAAAVICLFFRFEKIFGKYKKLEIGRGGIKLEAGGGKDAVRDEEVECVAGKLKNIETLLEKDAAARKKRQGELDRRLDAQYEFIKEAVLKACTAIVFADNVPLIEFFYAVFMSLYLGANGNTVNRVTKRIVKDGQNLEIYKSELAKFKKEHKKPNAHFESAVKQIHDEWH
jgi:hypothetical protein